MNRGKRRDNGRFLPTYSHILTKEYLEENYIKNHKSPYTIANEVGCSPRLVYDYISHFKLPKQCFRGHIKPNQRFGLLTTVEVVGKSKNGTFLWQCICDCGNKKQIVTSELKNGSRKSCGCLRYRSGESHHKFTGYCGITGKEVSEIRWRARKKKWKFDLTAKFLWELWEKHGGFCAISGMPISLDKNASLDRIDSTKGYIKTNVWWVHRDINKMKLDFPLDRFIELCKTVAENKKED